MEGNGSHVYVILLEIAAFTMISASSLCNGFSLFAIELVPETYFHTLVERNSLYINFFLHLIIQLKANTF
jgi:hypothetical protein